MNNALLQSNHIQKHYKRNKSHNNTYCEDIAVNMAANQILDWQEAKEITALFQAFDFALWISLNFKCFENQQNT